MLSSNRPSSAPRLPSSFLPFPAVPASRRTQLCLTDHLLDKSTCSEPPSSHPLSPMYARCYAARFQAFSLVASERATSCSEAGTAVLACCAGGCRNRHTPRKHDHAVCAPSTRRASLSPIVKSPWMSVQPTPQMPSTLVRPMALNGPPAHPPLLPRVLVTDTLIHALSLHASNPPTNGELCA
ncbi:hypothetical protein BV20DRAFT_963788 [Pilatotrama ljubarskyi]|nr:hypothetical protein BV20DRAFT_963788 [Pilatotrama ljubarskyi]